MIRFLNDRNPIYIVRGWASNISNPQSMTTSHATVITGYVWSGTEYRFLVKDPAPQNQGSARIMSYEKIYNGRNYQSGESSDTGIWLQSIVVETSYSNETLPYYFDQ